MNYLFRSSGYRFALNCGNQLLFRSASPIQKNVGFLNSSIRGGPRLSYSTTTTTTATTKNDSKKVVVEQVEEDDHDHSQCGHSHSHGHGHSHAHNVHHQARPVGDSTIRESDEPVPSSAKSIFVKDLSSPEDYNYVFQRVKQFDRENYVCSILISDELARRAAFAIRAFNIETVILHSEVKSDIRLAKYKLSFWKDAINNIYNGKVYDQPLIRVLAQQIKERGLSKTWFIRLLNRREKDLNSVQMKDMDELEAYAEEIHGSLLLLNLESLGVRNSDAEHAASHLGRAMGIMTLIRGTPFHIKTRKIYIPASLTTKYGIVTERLYQGEDEQVLKLKEAIFEMASVAKIHLEKARSFKVPAPAHEAFLCAEFADDFLERLRKSDFNIFDPTLRDRIL
ncbi:UPF0551 family protein [Heterostelium album PN500]|uniref:UPF0551 family protein n=1 Tax=Heterostelium pallidum (strain ATCC 26659 / Pp 5 / PN500) TaxID=670386 RepID=D3AXW4_HETP5|nr:UPF0551 family protein [Heterostelium album PN500]EFA85791.1 UPF0551 family protein [Heterostelium album PN500]|eukprot:XP_020437897.1 UPF0551 family protein [Heterostelium album PN500]